MQTVPNEILQRAYERRPFALLKLPLLWALVFGLGFTGYWAAAHTAFGIPVGVAAGVAIGTLVRGLGSIGHDAVHGCVSRSKAVSYWVGICAWNATMMSYTLYSAYHLDHHRIVNMPHDVDRVDVSRFTSDRRFATFLRLAIYTCAYPVYWALEVRRYAARLSFWLKLRMYLEFVAIGVGLAALYPVMGKIAWLSVLGTQALVGAFFASVTSIVEHFGIPYHPDHAQSARTYGAANRFVDWVWSGTSFHLEHHKYPGIPFYNLRRFHFEASPYYSPAVRANVHQTFWPLVFSQLKRAARLGLEEERAAVQRDATAVEVEIITASS